MKEHERLNLNVCDNCEWSKECKCKSKETKPEEQTQDKSNELKRTIRND